MWHPSRLCLADYREFYVCGIWYHPNLVVLILGAALPLMTILIGNLTNLLGGIVSPGAHGVQSLSSVQEFHTKVAHQALVLVCVGIAVFVATYVGTVCWIITGERISRRIRMYVFSLGLS